MSLFDSILGQVRQHVDIDNLAAKVGLTPAQVEQGIGALTHEHTQPGDTVASAAASTGIGGDQLAQIMAHVGGEGALARFSQMLGADGAGGGLGGIMGALDKDGDGNPLDDIAGMAGGLFGKN